MFRYILQRLFYAIITLWLIITVTFVLMKLLPGNPLGEASLKMSKENFQILLAQYGLDKPEWQQYLIYLKNVIKGDLGVSFQFPARDVTSMISSGFKPSFELGIYSICVALVFGLLLGIIAALNHNKWQDRTAIFIAVIGVSIPSFVLGPLLAYYIGNKLGWLPAALWKGPSYKILPTLALSFGTLANVARMMRTSMLDVLNQDYIKTAKAKGLASHTVVWRHTIRNAIMPVVTIIGPVFAGLITGTLVVEQVFSVPGLGKQLVNAIYSNDYTVISGMTIFYSAILIVVILITDILYGYIDPRIRLGKGGK
ncbi:ABC transporter permease [Paenibacillus chitinolyticus]|uniref:ABC transporter permease n=1 Tax=Paenibacillus chitinolyticus TaxID=79263 RepID=UPI003655CFAE